VRILVTGAGGMLASDLIPLLRDRGHEVIALSRQELDVSDPDAVDRRLGSVAPEVVVQCAAYTDVDGAESDEGTAALVNATATGFIVRACQKIGARLVYPSTDYVFDGTAATPYGPDQVHAPINAYGRSKAAGERAAMEGATGLIVRTSWLYGAGGRNFVDTILRLAREREHLDIVCDQIGRPTWTADLAEVMAILIERGEIGIFHASGGGDPTSWHGFAAEAVRIVGLDCRLEPVDSGAFPRPARRPLYSVLDVTRTESVVGFEIPDWKQSLRRYIKSAGRST
jgi:dTDP-4-dehydrorhamnose reductase